MDTFYTVTPTNDDRLQIPGYTLIRSDHPKPGGVCVYYKSSLPLRAIVLDCKLAIYLYLRRPLQIPSQSQDEFETFADNFEMTLQLLAQKNLFLLRAITSFRAFVFSIFSSLIKKTNKSHE